MLLRLAIHQDSDSVYGISIPDLPSCFSYGESIEMARYNARLAVIGSAIQCNGRIAGACRV